MVQFLDHKDDTQDFMFYMTIPSKAGTPDFEHKVRIKHADCKHGKKLDGSDDPDVLVVECQCGCGSVAYVPVNGDEEAQRLHAKVKHVKENKPYTEQSVQEVIDKVKAKGGEAKLDPKRG